MDRDADVVVVSADGRVDLTCAESLPDAGAYLWNPALLVQANCRGYVAAQHLQPEPARYSRAPVLEQTTFMQPEQPYFAHHPGRFVYVRDDENGVAWSAPAAPMGVRPDRFRFSATDDTVSWVVERDGITVELSLLLPAADPVELWSLAVTNSSPGRRRVSAYPCFSIGYMSWMNQSARYDRELGGIVASSITPYQKLEDYPKVASLKDLTYLLHDTEPHAWEASATAFEGAGGLHKPAALDTPALGNGAAVYEMPIAALQYRLDLAPGERREFRFLFGPAATTEEIRMLRERFLAAGAFERAAADYRKFRRQAAGCISVSTPSPHFDAFTNHWLARQVHYHGSANRFTTDPQTRNYLQDAMGMVYVDPGYARSALLTALGQQQADGRMPDGIRLYDDAVLKYINQVPHTDHCVWLPVLAEAYLDETGDVALLDEKATRSPFGTVFDAVLAACDWLLGNLDSRHLSRIDQGDWCDPLNMVGPAGRGISGWLTIATVYACRRWARICRLVGNDADALRLSEAANRVAAAAQEHLWDGAWFARGITDAGRTFGVSGETEGRLYLNPQSWAILADVASPEQAASILASVDAELDTPFGTAMLAPPYTGMHEDIGRISQKFPGTAENGSVYNHAAAFYIAALFELGESDRAFRQFERAIPGPAAEDYRRRGQLPVFVPNYYRGAWRLHPDRAGRSSRLFNTGAASWLYRIVVERLFGLRGCADGLVIAPALPSAWQRATATRRFRGAIFDVHYRRDPSAKEMAVTCDGRTLPDAVIRAPASGRRYRIDVSLPTAGSVPEPATAAARPEATSA